MFGLSYLAVVPGSFIPPEKGLGIFFKDVRYQDGIKEFKDSGTTKLYSVDYNNGNVYLSHTVTDADALSKTFSYSYTNYEASYRIARLVDKKHYDVNIPDKQIAIKDGEFFKHLETPKTTESGTSAYYLVNYDYVAETRENIEELRDYFTPVIKDYSLKVIKVIPTIDSIKRRELLSIGGVTT